MNRTKRTFNPLLSDSFRYEQSEDTELLYTGNWGHAIQPLTISSSAWEVISGTATISGEANTTTQTSVIVSGTVGEVTLQNKVTLSDGQVEARLLKIRIKPNEDPFLRSDYWGDCR